ncbi:hypothetical protein GIY30_21720 [Gordonia sp. HNM0687]|uniref:Uncharacterized protein n=1 Tax=Gordonia mangrovi TaxID=2665643 RepID=A0A6L7GXV0_9ACTN|nr:hypothetical protein [Gordonia mangrovi]MXP23961.1 hypothetical protein [Gordonia mangrovi]UVF76508.1 hypothetical protein NWF22_14130 [Gordonia mangrovi]
MRGKAVDEMGRGINETSACGMRAKVVRRVVAAGFAGAAMAGAMAFAAAPASAQPLPTIEPTVENAAPTLDNIKLGITKAVESNPALEPVGDWALTLFPKY